MLLKLKSWSWEAPHLEHSQGLYCLHFPETEEARHDQVRDTQGLVFRQLRKSPQAHYLYR